MTEINNVSAFANTGASKITENSVSTNYRKKIQKEGLEFKQDKNLSDAEMKLLKKEFGMDEAQVRQWAAMENGVEFLEAMLHAGGGSTDKKEIKAAREQVALKFLLGNRTQNLGSGDIKLEEQLKEFGVDVGETSRQVLQNSIDRDAPIVTITPDPSTGNTTVSKVRIAEYPTIDGGTSNKTLLVYDVDSDLETQDVKATLSLDSETGLYVLRGDYSVDPPVPAKYYKLNGTEGYNLTEVSEAVYKSAVADIRAAKDAEAARIEEEARVAEEARLAEEARAAEAAKAEVAANTKSTFASAKTITVDSTGSKQKLWIQDVRETGVKVLNKKGHAENGLPKEIAIELPSSYGSASSDGVGQKRYQHWVLKDAEKGIYTDKSGIRKFQALIDDNGKITFKQIEINDDKTKAFLNANATATAEKAKANILNKDKTEFKDFSNDDVKTIISDLKDRNKSWTTYLQSGTENGYYTGALGLIEELSDEGHVKNFEELQPILDGLLSRVPENVARSPEYQAVMEQVNAMKADPNSINSYARKLDMALMNLAKEHLAGNVDGTNYANNSYLVGGTGANRVVIQPTDPNSIWKTDAQFNVGGKDYFLYRDDITWDKCYDFQDVIGYETADRKPLITNDITGNNRKGEITFHADRLEGGKKFYFQTDGGKKLKVTVKDGVAYVVSSNGKRQVPVNDILNGRANMPE